jgi:hypothetical protein
MAREAVREGLKKQPGVEGFMSSKMRDTLGAGLQ